MNFLAQLNWSAMIVTAMICCTALKALQHLRYIARIWLDGLRVELQIQMLIHGRYSEWRNAQTQSQNKKGA
jgi:hypothetical protein